MLLAKTLVGKAERFTSWCRKVLNETSKLLLAFFYTALKGNKLRIIGFYIFFLENGTFDSFPLHSSVMYFKPEI